jgi:hypothetical protein
MTGSQDWVSGAGRTASGGGAGRRLGTIAPQHSPPPSFRRLPARGPMVFHSALVGGTCSGHLLGVKLRVPLDHSPRDEVVRIAGQACCCDRRSQRDFTIEDDSIACGGQSGHDLSTAPTGADMSGRRVWDGCVEDARLHRRREGLDEFDGVVSGTCHCMFPLRSSLR